MCSGVEQQKLVLSMEQTCAHRVKQENGQEPSCETQRPLQVATKKEQGQEKHEDAGNSVMELETPSGVEALGEEPGALTLIAPPITGDAIISLDLSSGWRPLPQTQTLTQTQTQTPALSLILPYIHTQMH